MIVTLATWRSSIEHPPNLSMAALTIISNTWVNGSGAGASQAAGPSRNIGIAWIRAAPMPLSEFVHLQQAQPFWHWQQEHLAVPALTPCGADLAAPAIAHSPPSLQQALESTPRSAVSAPAGVRPVRARILSNRSRIWLNVVPATGWQAGGAHGGADACGFSSAGAGT